ncbi:MAG: ABC transporter ATP-binding protein [SAR202 cluster bacterium]|jgi:putative ABC transport system ATP-binding protein|nr:ABC transporter ATP-binding protein [SAR202 cluster bacterium]
MPFLEATNLHKTYRLGRLNKVYALRGVDMSIEAGEMVAIMGPSGCGKSTLMHILGLLHGPDQDLDPPATLIIKGNDVTGMSENVRTRMRASCMGFVFQSFNLVPTLTAAENVALPAIYSGRKRADANVAASEALEWVGLSEWADHRPTELSGGQQQRVAIARAQVTKPDLLLADEPTGNLDSASTTEVLDLLRRFNEENGQTIVIVTHDDVVGDACGRVLTMLDGVIADAPAA